MSVQDDDSARGERLPPIDVPALLGRFREGYGIRQLSAWCGHGQGAIEDVLREALRGQAWQPIKTLDYGRRVLLLWPGKGPDVCAGSKHHSGDDAQPYWIFDGHWTNPAYPTHWQPLPAPPAARETGD